MSISKQVKIFLERLGLNEKEITMYLYGITVAPQHVSVLAKACNLSRSNAYDVVRKLEEKGLCSNLGSLYGRRIKMASPQEISRLIDRKRSELTELHDSFDAISSSLNDITKQSPFIHPRVTYYQGQEGVRQLFDDSLQSKGKEILTAISEKDLISVLGKEFILDYVHRRVAKGLISKSIRSSKKHDDHEVLRDHEKNLRIVRYKPKDIVIKAVILMYDNTVAFITTDEETFGTKIESADYAATMKSWFEVLWDISKEY
jgi:sugar-specific transcriptional regulator TrmB